MQMTDSTHADDRNGGARVSQHYWTHGRLLSGSYKTPITIQCNSKDECDQVQAKLKDPTFTSDVAASAGVPASAFKSVSEPASYDTASFAAQVITTHSVTAGATVATHSEAEFDKWRNGCIALIVICVLMLIAIGVLASKVGGSGGGDGAVRGSQLEKALDEEDSYTV
jgi:hypothetical protein